LRDDNSGGTVRVLNILVDESRILASRERCPYLVHLEVAETGLRGSDSRLYASGARGIGATIEEALSLSAKSAPEAASADANAPIQLKRNYHIPNELLSTPPWKIWYNSNNSTPLWPITSEARMEMPRGGWQAEEAFYSHNPEDVFSSNLYDTVRENEFQQLHEQMHSEYGMMDQPQTHLDQRYVMFKIFFRRVHWILTHFLIAVIEAHLSPHVKFC